jgi:hypothetical protein
MSDDEWDIASDDFDEDIRAENEHDAMICAQSMATKRMMDDAWWATHEDWVKEDVRG